MKTSPLVIAALFAIVSADTNADVMEAKQHMHDQISTNLNPDKVKKFNNDLVTFDRSVRSAGRAIRRDFRDYDLETRQPKMEIDKALYEYIEEKEKIDEGYAQAWQYASDNVHFDKGTPNGEGKLYMSNS